MNAERCQSLACVRIRLRDENGKPHSVGCGYGWTASEIADPACPRCGRPAKITGAFTVIDLRERVAS